MSDTSLHKSFAKMIKCFDGETIYWPLKAKNLGKMEENFFSSFIPVFRRIQCDQMAQLFQNICTIYNNENLPISRTFLPK